MIIDSGKRNGKPDEVAALLRKIMGLEADEPLHRDAIQKFLDKERANTVDIPFLRLYLEDNNLLNRGGRLRMEMTKEERTKMFKWLKTQKCPRCGNLHIIIDPDDKNERLISCECEKCCKQWKLNYEGG